MSLNKKTLCALVFIWLVLAATPSYLLIKHQQVFPWLDLSSLPAALLYFLTSTGTAPYAVMSVISFLAISFIYVPKLIWTRLVFAVVLSVTISFTLNHQLKSYFKEARPNAVFLSTQTQSPIDLESFYLQDPVMRSALITQALQQYQTSESSNTYQTTPPISISPMIQDHWIGEVGYAFPSGHTIFAITLVLTASYYLLLSGATVLNVLLVTWGILMGGSRMLLGMHWPQDVLASTCLAAVISLLSVLIVEKMRRSK
ncbi:phosphatase PAP2 family protein [Vibrio rumoiensis]|uniref:undecaprenyl-diphosphate phosphatase n=1 Tax=Vibrio rumoiensis 1S-45 TaxID=1188252 RepID=A0A1E5DZE4_9VIBR|nr:phosphatase PAP2 family protein [Vibrio rumoiensis]OEF23294.1 phosphoesterase [Vibrio rumoiensis 1S-45]